MNGRATGNSGGNSGDPARVVARLRELAANPGLREHREAASRAADRVAGLAHLDRIEYDPVLSQDEVRLVRLAIRDVVAAEGAPPKPREPSFMSPEARQELLNRAANEFRLAAWLAADGETRQRPIEPAERDELVKAASAWVAEYPDGNKTDLVEYLVAWNLKPFARGSKPRDARKVSDLVREAKVLQTNRGRPPKR